MRFFRFFTFFFIRCYFSNFHARYVGGLPILVSVFAKKVAFFLKKGSKNHPFFGNFTHFSERESPKKGVFLDPFLKFRKKVEFPEKKVSSHFPKSAIFHKSRNVVHWILEKTPGKIGGKKKTFFSEIPEFFFFRNFFLKISLNFLNSHLRSRVPEIPEIFRISEFSEIFRNFPEFFFFEKNFTKRTRCYKFKNAKNFFFRKKKKFPHFLNSGIFRNFFFKIS